MLNQNQRKKNPKIDQKNRKVHSPYLPACDDPDLVKQQLHVQSADFQPVLTRKENLKNET